MTKSKRILAGVVLSLSCVTLLASCGGDTNTSNAGNTSGATTSKSPAGRELWIMAYDGGYGKTWLNNMATEFTAKTGITVHTDVSTTLLDRLESDLKNGTDYDLYMSHGINWMSYAAQGYLAPMDDLYTTKIDGFTDKTFADRLVAGAADISKAEGSDGTSPLLQSLLHPRRRWLCL